MKTMWHLVVSSVIGLSALSCSQQATIEPTPKIAPDESTIQVESSYQRTQEQARSIALAFIQKEHKGARGLTRGNLQASFLLRSSIQELRSTGGNATQFVDTLLYVFNSQEPKSCLLISGDNRLPEVIGYIPQDTLGLNQIPRESGISLFFSDFPEYYKRSIEEDQTFRKKIKPWPDQRDFDPQLDRHWTTYTYQGDGNESIAPICPVQWGQLAPFNSKAPLIDGVRAVAGCTAVATAQLMACHKYPPSIPGQALDWELLSRSPQSPPFWAPEYESFSQQVSSLLRLVGDLLDNTWGVEATGAYTRGIPRALKSLGYSHTPQEISYNCEAIIASLNSGSPVILSGFNRPKTKGHAWLCDGYKTHIIKVVYGVDRRRRDYDTPEQFILATRSKIEYLLHHNWGWDGYLDGFFVAGVFIPDRKIDLSHHVNCIPGIKP